MKYTKQERLDIGCRVYNNEFTKREAAEKFEISETTLTITYVCIGLKTSFRREDARIIR